MFTSTTVQAPLIEDEHGVIRIGQTRVTLLSVLNEYETGASPEAIADAFPSLSLADIYATIAYYLLHQDEVDSYLGELRSQVKARHMAGHRLGLREKLQARLLENK